jgi:hypothetical protein
MDHFLTLKAFESLILRAGEDAVVLKAEKKFSNTPPKRIIENNKRDSQTQTDSPARKKLKPTQEHNTKRNDHMKGALFYIKESKKDKLKGYLETFSGNISDMEGGKLVVAAKNVMNNNPENYAARDIYNMLKDMYPKSGIDYGYLRGKVNGLPTYREYSRLGASEKKYILKMFFKRDFDENKLGEFKGFLKSTTEWDRPLIMNQLVSVIKEDLARNCDLKKAYKHLFEMYIERELPYLRKRAHYVGKEKYWKVTYGKYPTTSTNNKKARSRFLSQNV